MNNKKKGWCDVDLHKGVLSKEQVFNALAGCVPPADMEMIRDGAHGVLITVANLEAFAAAIARLATEAQAEKVRGLFVPNRADPARCGAAWADGFNACRLQILNANQGALFTVSTTEIAPPAAGDAQDAARWIPVSERLPELDTEFAWLATKDGEVLSGTRGWQQGWSPDYWDTRELGMIDFENVTHWQPVKVPAPPAMQKGGGL